ncbi:MAG: hypothetical protein JWN94_3057, partial [Betaproteobacteria bacterium]|nr:hypothetical protein [Betaproteobacteria bacterium]
MSGKLIHCIYASAAKSAFSNTALAELLAKARKNNRSLEATGMLLYADGSFFQVIEGEAAMIDALFVKIAA